MATTGEMANTTDPLQLLPSEIVLRILEFTPTSGLASLTRLNRSWNSFIDKTHQEAIYSIPERTPHPPNSKDFKFLENEKTFSPYYESIASWKDLCKRQTLLARNWNSQTPVTRESTIRVGNDPVWRFKPDFERRIILSTSHAGGMNVTDMDTGRLLWRLDIDDVRPFAHLEYQDGTAVWDREGNALEVWRTGMDGLARGQFRRVKVLEHDRMTRGFQLSFDTLCVVSNEGLGYVYEDMLGDPKLKRKIDIEEGAVGHLDQSEGVVVYSMGNDGYHFFEKETGKALGVLDPEHHDYIYHVKHPETKFRRGPGLGNLANQGRNGNLCPPRKPARDRTVPLAVRPGALWDDEERVSLNEDEWGAGMLKGDLFVGVSRGGRLAVSSNWRKALEKKTNKWVTLVECDTDGSNFDLGGWLSVRDHRVMFEIQDLIYVIGLTDEDYVRCTGPPSFATATSITAQLAVPVSFMGIYDDCIMATYTVSGLLELVLTPANTPADSPLSSSSRRRCGRASESLESSSAHQSHPHSQLCSGLGW